MKNNGQSRDGFVCFFVCLFKQPERQAFRFSMSSLSDQMLANFRKVCTISQHQLLRRRVSFISALFFQFVHI